MSSETSTESQPAFEPWQLFTLAGHWVRIVLRFLGPTLFGVMLLAIWGRVKR